MRMTKFPLPLLIAAAAITGTAVIYVYLTAPPMPIHTDPNFTSPLFVGMTYLWRGAAFDYLFSADYSISMTYMPVHHLMYLTGPPSNITIGDNVWIVYVRGWKRPYYIIKHHIDWSPGGWSGYYYFVFWLEDVTPPNLTIRNLYLWLPRTFDPNDVLTQDEFDAIYKFVPSAEITRVLRVEVNSTHVTFIVSAVTYYDAESKYVAKLPSPVSGTSIRITNKPISASYTFNGTTFSAMALPYNYFSITPSDTTTLVVYVS